MNKKEFLDFMNQETTPPSSLGEKILSAEKSILKKERLHSILLVVGVHAVAGLATLSICPQFGWNPFGANPHTMHIFMEYGMWACGLFCGVLFMLTGSILSALLLPRISNALYYRKTMRNSLIVSSLFFFMLMTAGLYTSSDNLFLGLSFSIFWYLGAVFSEVIGKFFFQIKKALV